jgi:hypothetical protein
MYVSSLRTGVGRSGAQGPFQIARTTAVRVVAAAAAGDDGEGSRDVVRHEDRHAARDQADLLRNGFKVVAIPAKKQAMLIGLPPVHAHICQPEGAHKW